jgi:hypothetical protein
MPRPGHRGHHHPMIQAGRPWHIRFQIHPRRARIHAPPAPPPLTLVIAWRAAPTPPVPAPPGPTRPYTSHQHFLGPSLFQIHPLDYRVLDFQHRWSYSGSAHAVPPKRSFLTLTSQELSVRKTAHLQNDHDPTPT